jgi:imidazolonepropionase-like amidohydrolase
VGLDSERLSRYPSSDHDVDRVIEADGKCIVPGLVDAHSPSVGGGPRS